MIEKNWDFIVMMLSSDDGLKVLNIWRYACS